MEEKEEVKQEEKKRKKRNGKERKKQPIENNKETNDQSKQRQKASTRQTRKQANRVTERGKKDLQNSRRPLSKPGNFFSEDSDMLPIFPHVRALSFSHIKCHLNLDFCLASCTISAT